MDEESKVSDDVTQSPLQREIVRCVFKFILVSVLQIGEGRISVRGPEERKAAISLLYMARQYAGEMSECAGNSIRLAATVMACSLLEALLMLACLCYKDNVSASKAWRKNQKAKRNNTFLQNLERTELALLLAVAEELGWFSAEIPDVFKDEVGTDDLAELLTFIPQDKIPSVIAATLGKDVRNRLHPGYCLRFNENFTDSKSLLMGIGFMGLALVSFVKVHGNDASETTIEDGSPLTT